LKLIYFLPLLLIGIIPIAFADNLLENEHLFAESGIIALDLQFGDDIVRYGSTITRTTSTIEDITLTFYGDEINMSDSRAKVYANGDAFSITNIDNGIVMYGHYNDDLQNYKINVLFAGQNGFIKYTINTAAELQDDKVVESEPKEVKEKYIPDLIITTDHDFKTYWRESFDIEIMAYDENKNDRPDLNRHGGTIDGVDINVIISLEDEKIATLSGVTEYGQWKGSYYFVENLSTPGEYVVDVIASYLGKTASETSSMFVIGTVANGGSSGGTPTANVGANYAVGTSTNGHTLDGTGSFDNGGSIVSYSWTQVSGTGVTINNANMSIANFDAPGAATTLIFQLVVTDNSGKSDSDTVTVTVS